jgi:cytochrome c oxidase subunit 2
MGMDALMAEGRNVHLTYCAACHQADGSGLPAAGFPALANLQIGLEEHIQTVVHGRNGTAMAAFGPQLSDEQLAAVITFQRNAFGNETGDTAQPADIAGAR